MSKKKKDTNAEHMKISYPDSLNKKCPVCCNEVVHLYPSPEKTVHTFNGPIYQIIELYQCSNVDCYLNQRIFNPTPMFNDSNMSYGNDIIQWIAEELFLRKQSVKQIHDKITLEKKIAISLETIDDFVDGIRSAKTTGIDENTLEIIKKQGFIILGLDGKDPRGKTEQLWCFKDLTTDRVLYTVNLSQINIGILHEIIEAIREYYNVPIVGWMSDYQDLIRKCHDKFYSDIPHVYCHDHFLDDVFPYLSELDNRLYMSLKTAITSLYFQRPDDSVKINIGGRGLRSVQDIFKELGEDLMRLTKTKTIKFKQLRGLEIYTQLQEYVLDVRETYKDLDKTLHFIIVLFRILDNLQKELDELKERYLQVDKIWRIFLEIRSVLGSEKHPADSQRQSLKKLFDDLWTLSRTLGCPHSSPEKCKARSASKKMSEWECVCQMVRLFVSYETGLFAYTSFPKEIEVKNSLEAGFAKLSASFRGLLRKGKTDFRDVIFDKERIRLIHCDFEELSSDIIPDFEKYNIELLSTGAVETEHQMFTGFIGSDIVDSHYFGLFFEYQKATNGIKQGKK